MMLAEICAEIRNYFVKEKRFGKFEISGGNLIAPSDFLQNGQYFRIVGSVLNDGVYQYPALNLADEVFEGAVWAMAVPPAVIALTAEIEKFCEDNPASAYTSESFGGYSYSRGTDGYGNPTTWKHVFASRLNKWRKM